MIIILIPVATIITILIGARETLEIFGLSIQTPDYANYYQQYWSLLLKLENPYPITVYPIGFLAFSGVYAIYGLAPKIFFCLTWLYTGYLINGFCKKYNLTPGTTFYLCIAIIIINPVYLGTILISGHYDVVVGLCVLLAVYSLHHSDQIKSGIYTAFAFLFKFLGIILIFPLVIMKKKINWRVGVIFVALSGGIYLIGYLLWGPAVFQPFIDQLLRNPQGASILLVISDILGLDVSILVPIIILGGILVVSIALYFLNTDIISFSLILILGFFLISPVIYVHYSTWFLPLAVYWSITHNGKLKMTLGLYHIGGLIAALALWFIAGWISSVIIFCITALYIIMIYLNRKKDDKIEALPEK
jgi:hypothetical protein